MFKSAPMVELQAIVLSRDELAVLRGLGELGAMQLTKAEPGPDIDMPELPAHGKKDESARLERLRTDIDQVRRSLEIPVLPPTLRATEMTLDEAEEILRSIQEVLSGPLERRRSLLQLQNELAVTEEDISWYRGLGIPLEKEDQSSFLHFATGSIPAGSLEDLRKNAGEGAAFFPIKEQKGRQSLAAITSRQESTGLDAILQQIGFQPATLPAAPGLTVDTLLEKNHMEQEQIGTELERVKSDLQRFSKEYAQSLADMERFVDIESRLLEAGRKLSRTETTTLFTGWIPSAYAETLKQCVQEKTSGRYVMESTVPAGGSPDRVPVMLRHTPWLRPFEVLVTTYGLPGYGEMEPTLFVALSYVLMFGMMFGDAGHGMVLALCGLAAFIAGRSRNMRDFGLLLCFGGSSSIIFGIIYGSYFGIEPFKKYALWHDPLEGDPMGLMMLAIGFGVAMITLGLILNVINRFRRGDVIGGFLDKFGFAGLVFYWGALALLVNRAAIGSYGLTGLWIGLFLVVPMIGWAVKEPMAHLMGHGEANNEGLAGSIIESLVGTFEAALSFLANTISFVRLAAYAMSHAALLVAAFVLAAQLRDVSPGGSIWSLLIIILGNLAAIVLEGVIASVQAFASRVLRVFRQVFFRQRKGF